MEPENDFSSPEPIRYKSAIDSRSYAWRVIYSEGIAPLFSIFLTQLGT